MRRPSALLKVATLWAFATLFLFACSDDTAPPPSDTTTSSSSSSTGNGGEAGAPVQGGGGEGDGGEPTNGGGGQGGNGGQPIGGSGGDGGMISEGGAGGSASDGGSAGTGGEGGGVESCGADEKLCMPTGCVDTDIAHGCAGASCAPCAYANASALCDASDSCAMDVCNSGYTDCNNSPADGCESFNNSNCCVAWQAGTGLTCTNWMEHPDPDLAALNLVWGGQALTNTDAFVVGGTYQTGKILRYNGTDFVPQNVPANQYLLEVLALSSTEALAVGRGPQWDYDCLLIELGTGDTWNTVSGTPTLGTSGSCRSIWGQSSNELFLLGANNLGHHVFRGPKNGPWIEMVLPSFPGNLDLIQIWGTGANDIYVVGALLDANSNPVQGVLLHYDGNLQNQWSSLTVDPSVTALRSISGSGPCEVIVGGSMNNGVSDLGVTIHYDGMSWQTPVQTTDVSFVRGVDGRRGQNKTLAVGTDASSPPFFVSKFGNDEGDHSLGWTSPLSNYGYLRGLSTVPGSNKVFVFAETNGGQVLTADCN
ncbi:MAG: hypothetical protein WC787_00110 [Patescibacteria group bacterium]